MSDSFEMRPIARIRSDFGSKFGVPRQSGLVDALEAAVVFEEPYRNPDALRGLERPMLTFGLEQGDIHCEGLTWDCLLYTSPSPRDRG